jgi:sulfoxide reductase heme-binding subunit YedZ
VRIAKPVAFLALLSPAIWIAWAVLTNNAGANPVEYLTHGTGDWALRILLLTLAMTPLRMLTKSPLPIRFRRMLGLFAFFYGVLHFTVYLWLDKVFDIHEIWADIYKRPFITAGFTALVLMLPLALTSTKGMIRRLGGKRWQFLHRFIYVSAAAAVVHYWWLVKSDIRLPLLYAVILVILLSFRWRLVATLFAGAAVASAQQNMDLYLLIGQSNMAGRGVVEEQDRAAIPGIFALSKTDAWVPATDPLHWDKPAIAGVGLGRSFARAVKGSADVGLIPAAFGGTSLEQWKPGSALYQEAVRRTRVAMKAGTLRGILWHQGGAETTAQLATSYVARFALLILTLRNELGVPTVPVIVGALGPFLEPDKHPFAAEVNRQLQLIPTKVPNSSFVSADGLHDKGDKLHFDTASQRELGRRYATAYLALKR